MEGSSSRRVDVLAGHLAAPACDAVGPALAPALAAAPARPCPTCGHACASQGAPSSSYASATGAPTSYARVHGEVSRAPVRWERVPTVLKQPLQEVKYDKGEGIAKVRAFGQTVGCCGTGGALHRADIAT